MRLAIPTLPAVAAAPERPIFVVGPPFCGQELIVACLSRASGVFRYAGRAPSFVDELPEADAAASGFDSHRLDADAAPALAEPARRALAATVLDREERPLEATEGVARALAGGGRLALRVPFLAAAFPDATFVLAAREPPAAAAEMLAAWRAGGVGEVEGLPGWEGPAWTLPLIPGWRSLAGEPLEDIVVEQWRAIAETVLDDLEALGSDRWCVAGYEGLLADPRAEIQRLCAFLDLDYDQALITPAETGARAGAAATPEVPAELGEVLGRAAGAAERLRELVAPVAPPPDRRARPGSAFASVSTATFPRALARLRSSLLVSTYQSGKLICARERDGQLNTHFRDFDKPMGIAVAGGRFALGTREEVWDLRDMPAVAPKIEPAGTHDACYLPRNRHTTGDIAIHEMAFAEGELWVVASAFSCLATLDSEHSFVPRWKPSFITEITIGDRCHLNGLAVVADRVRYVSALGTSNQAQGWRPGKATGGVVMEVPSSEVVVSGLSMPHSPRWHNGRLWVLQSGRGEMSVVDLDRGTTDTVCELPGFCRGLAFAGRTAFVGLSQIRESSTFGDLPLTQRLRERVSGVWMVDTVSGEVEGFLRFDDVVQEVFDVALLAGKRFPEIAEPGSPAVSTSYELP